MSRNYATPAQQIVAAIGGVDSIATVTHCMTRLRFVIKDNEKVNSPILRGLAGVLGVVRSDNQCQVIIGDTVSQAYREVVNLSPGDLRPAEPQDRAPLALKRIDAGILDALIDTVSPLIPTVIGGSMIKLLVMILKMNGALLKDSPTLALLTLINDDAFFLLPLMMATSAAIKFKTNISLAIAIAGVLVHPGFIELVAKATQDEHVGLAFIPVTAVKYTYIVIPVLVMAWCLSYIRCWVDRITPAVTKNFFKPMLIVLIAAPLAILLIGPLDIWIDDTISALAYAIHSYLDWLSVAIISGLWPLLVMTRMHHIFTSTIIQAIAETGKEGMVMLSGIGASPSLDGSSLAVAWKTENPEPHQAALAVAASAILAGISESTLYGMTVRLKRPLIISLISGFICSAVAGTTGLASHSMATPGLFTNVRFFNPTNPMTIVWVFGMMVLPVVLSFALTLVLGFENIPVEQTTTNAVARQARAQASRVRTHNWQ